MSVSFGSLRSSITNVSRRSNGRLFSTTSRVLQEDDLHLHPERWMGLPTPQIFELYRKRSVNLGINYKKHPAELAALLTTAKDTGSSLKQIRENYEKYRPIKTKINKADALKPFMYDDYNVNAKEIIDVHRMRREYNRAAAYELPLLAKYRKEYVPPNFLEKPLTFTYTTFLGENQNPADRKVVLTVDINYLGLSQAEEHKFKLLAGPRYDHSNNMFKMSSNKFGEAAQNSRYLSDIFNVLLKESRNLEDDFSDIPLDRRHTEKKQKNAKKVYIFPEEWNRPQDAPVKKYNIAEDFLARC